MLLTAEASIDSLYMYLYLENKVFIDTSILWSHCFKFLLYGGLPSLHKYAPLINFTDLENLVVLMKYSSLDLNLVNFETNLFSLSLILAISLLYNNVMWPTMLLALLNG